MDLTALTQAVTNNTTVEGSAVTLIQTLADELKANAGDPAAVQALADQINASAKALGDAVAANTPAAPAPAP